MDVFGLDIGTSSIKLVQLRKDGDKFALVALGQANSPQPGIRGDSEKQWEETAIAIKSLISDARPKTKNAVFSLPEEDTISRLKWYPSMKESEIRTALEFDAETFIPHPMSKVEMDYQVVDRDEEGRLLLLVVASLKKTVEKYLKVAKMAGITITALEVPSISLARAFSIVNNPTLIVDFGSKYSNLVVAKNTNVFLTRTIPIGTEAFSRAVAISLGLEKNAAESYYRAYGLSETELEGKVKKALMPLFEKFVGEIKKTILAFKEEWGDDAGVVILAGGGANTVGFSEEITRMIGLEVQVVQPFAGVKISAPLTIDINKEGSCFAVAFGLATRGLI